MPVKTTQTFRRFSDDFSFSTTPGISVEAELLNRQFRDVAEHFRNAETLHGQATRELQDVFLDSREGNWDGYDALGVVDMVFLRAQRFLKEVLPRFPSPTFSATPAGNLSFEWFVSPRRRFLVCIGEEDRVAYAGLFGSDPIHGTAIFTDDVPSEIGDHLKRLFFLK